MATARLAGDTAVPTADVAIIGAGLSGLAAARELTAAQRSVIVVDKGRSVGGRLATRRVGGARLDHGAQFFTVRGKNWRDVIDAALADQIVFEWCRGFGLPDGYPRYGVHRGMNALAKWIGRGLEVITDTRIERLTINPVPAAGRDGDAAAVLYDATGPVVQAGSVIITSPVPQTRELLDASGLSLGDPLEDALATMEYFATLAVLVVLDRPSAIVAPGGMQFDDGPFTFVGDNQQKGISALPAVTFHANHEISQARFDQDETVVLAELLDHAGPYIGAAEVEQCQLKKWRYAGPVDPHPDRSVTVEINGVRITLAGDAFGGPKVEGAFNSGVHAAQRLLD